MPAPNTERHRLLAFSKTSIVYTDTHIIRERRQEIGGHTFVVSSVFDRFATKTAEDRLRFLVELEAEKDGRNAVWLIDFLAGLGYDVLALISAYTLYPVWQSKRRFI